MGLIPAKTSCQLHDAAILVNIRKLLDIRGCLTLSNDTSVTNPSGPAIEGSRTRVLAPLTYEYAQSSVHAEVGSAHRIQGVNESFAADFLQQGDVGARVSVRLKPCRLVVGSRGGGRHHSRSSVEASHFKLFQITCTTFLQPLRCT